MNVTVSCAGRFHSFELAHQLNRYGALHKLITSYPKFEVQKYGIPKELIHSLVYWEALNRAWASIANVTGMNRVHLQFWLGDLFDKLALHEISEKQDVYIGWSSGSERGIQKAKERGALTILERGSAHIELQTELLQDEYKQFSQKKNLRFTHPQIIEKELKEYELSDYISVPSTFAKQSFLDKGFRSEKIIMNPYGVSLNLFSPVQKPDDVFRVLYVGQMSLQKGTHYLLEAFCNLKLKNAELVLVGPRNAEIEPFFDRFKGQYTYIGPVPQSELLSYYNNSSVFVLSSVQDGMAMVIAQAMACALPVICTTNSAGGDLIENGKEGFVIPIRDVGSIRDKIVWMYEHKVDSREMGLAGRQKIINGFSWDDYGNRYYSFLEKICKN